MIFPPVTRQIPGELWRPTLVRVPASLSLAAVLVTTTPATASGCAAASDDDDLRPRPASVKGSRSAAPAYADESPFAGSAAARPYRAPGEDLPLLDGACEFRAPEFFPDEDMGSKFGPPDPPEGAGHHRAPAIRLSLLDPSVAGRPYVIRAEVVHDNGLSEVSMYWVTNMQPRWEYRCGGPKPPGVEVGCTQIGSTYIFVVVPPRGEHNFGVSARAVDGGSSSQSIATVFERCIE